jgi:polysaccharide biosynthesis/export protein
MKLQCNYFRIGLLGSLLWSGILHAQEEIEPLDEVVVTDEANAVNRRKALEYVRRMEELSATIAASPTKPAGEGSVRIPSSDGALSEAFYLPFSEEDLKLQIGDVVDISVFGQPDTIATDVPVAPDGKIYYMFLKGIQAEGRTVAAVEEEIESRIVHLFNSPEVTLIPTQFAANRVKIFGKVRVPGVYQISNPLTIRQAVARAQGIAQGTYLGSTREIADFEKSWIMRDGQKLPVNFKELFKQGDASQDIYVRPGDTIFIASAVGQEVYLLGAIPQPMIVPYSDDMTMVKLISGRMTGGWLEDADIKRVAVVRGEFPDPELFFVDLKAIVEGREPDVFLMSGDIVFMPEKRFLFARNLTKAGVSMLVRSFFRELGSDFTDKYLFPEESGYNDL